MVGRIVGDGAFEEFDRAIKAAEPPQEVFEKIG
jgi:hypothetical protein